MLPSLSAVALDAAMIVYTTWLADRAGVSLRVRRVGAGVAIGWLVVLVALLPDWGPLPELVSGPVFFVVVLAAVGAVGILLLQVRPALLGLSQRELLLPQGIRVVFGASFLVQAATGGLPATFGILDGLTHVGAGFFALLAASFTAEEATPLSWFANLFGLADILVVASTLAFLLLPELGLHHPMMFAVFLPAPFWLWLHLVALYKASSAAALAGTV